MINFKHNTIRVGDSMGIADGREDELVEMVKKWSHEGDITTQMEKALALPDEAERYYCLYAIGCLKGIQGERTRSVMNKRTGAFLDSLSNQNKKEDDDSN